MNKLSKILIGAFALVCFGLIGCVHFGVDWEALTVEQKAELACEVGIDLFSPECLRFSTEQEQQRCLSGVETVVKPACHAAIKKDVNNVCTVFSSPALVNDFCGRFSNNSYNVSSCRRVFTAAYGACVLRQAGHSQPEPEEVN